MCEELIIVESCGFIILFPNSYICIFNIFYNLKFKKDSEIIFDEKNNLIFYSLSDSARINILSEIWNMHC